MKIEFAGAAQGVTGSKHLLHINGKKILLDCGLFQGHRKDSIIRNNKWPFEVSEIDVMVLSHAHIDHSGAIPILYKKGFRGTIYCTHATRDLCAVMLRDSAYIQERDAEWIKKKKKQADAKPLYTIEDAEKCLSLFRSVPYHQKIRIDQNISFTFHDAGHILGSALEEWDIFDTDTKRHIRFGFTGDLGRKCLPILKDREQLTALDFLMTESTYGNRLHDEIKTVEENLIADINRTIDRGGKVFIPTFAVGRTQEILFLLKKFKHEKKIPHIPIFVDSPLAKSATEVFELHPECFDKEMQKLLEAGKNPFCDCEGTQFTHSVEESKALNEFPGPAIILSASGMCEFGRIRHHLANNISNEKNLLLIVGFMAEHTLGRKLVEGESSVNIFGEPHPVKMEVKIYNAFSAHADQRALLDFSGQAGDLKNVFLIHGEFEAQSELRERMRSDLPNMKTAEIHIPAPGDIYELSIEGRFEKSHEENEISKSLFKVDQSKIG